MYSLKEIDWLKCPVWAAIRTCALLARKVLQKLGENQNEVGSEKC